MSTTSAVTAEGWWARRKSAFAHTGAAPSHCERSCINIVIASVAKQSRLSPRKDSGLLRYARNDEATLVSTRKVPIANKKRGVSAAFFNSI
ncbi:hypothetical protein [Bradyrhizobium sp. LA6.12]|uniref:hypothetical protein n=1 Tax=unclassified Bradyrhizobium TaxID=2631580 RepID=UPI0033939C00